MARMDFIESRVELSGCCVKELDDWVAIRAHVCGGRGEGCGI
jgi:hypothetical protein